MKEEQPFDKVHYSLQEILLHNFLGGIAWGLGVTVGLALVFTIFGFLFSQINLIPIVGEFLTDIVSYVMKNNPQLR